MMATRFPAYWLVLLAVAVVATIAQLVAARVRARRWVSAQRARLARQHFTQP